RGPVRASPASARRDDRALLRAGAEGGAQARHEPRRVRLLRRALRDHGDRRGHPFADDGGAAVRGRRRTARRIDRARAREGDLPGELDQLSARRRDRARDGCDRVVPPLRGHARPEGLERRHVPRDGARERERDHPWLDRRPERLRVSVLVRAVDLAAAYPQAETPAIEHVTFELAAGERIGVLGPNGGGKSTLFRVLLGELEATHGVVEGGDRFAFVPQTERSRLDYPVS